jgi:hypothetical protein
MSSRVVRMASSERQEHPIHTDTINQIRAGDK